VIRISDRTVIATVPTNDHPCGIEILPNGEYVYVSAYSAGCVDIIRTSDNQRVGSVGVGATPDFMAMQPDSRRVYVACRRDAGVKVIGFPAE
jgi:DNA-binding beta-propeller fold protein YncE